MNPYFILAKILMAIRSFINWLLYPLLMAGNQHNKINKKGR